MDESAEGEHPTWEVRAMQQPPRRWVSPAARRDSDGEGLVLSRPRPEAVRKARLQECRP